MIFKNKFIELLKHFTKINLENKTGLYEKDKRKNNFGLQKNINKIYDVYLNQ